MRSLTRLAASGLVLASSTRLNAAGIIGIVLFCLIAVDASRRSTRVLRQLDDVIRRQDDQAEVIEEIRTTLATGGDDVPGDE